ASSLTTMAAFSPLLVVPGMFGELLRPIPLVIIFVLIAALVECFLVLPGHLHMSFVRSRGRPPTMIRERINAAVDRLRDHYYRPLMSWALRMRLFTVTTTLALFIVTIGLVAGGQVPFSMDLEIEAEEVFAEVEFIEGTSAADITAFVDQIRTGLNAADAEFVAQFNHAEPTLIRDSYYEYDLDAGTAFFMARLPSPDDRPFSNAEFLTAWDAHVIPNQSIDRLRIKSESSGGAGASNLTLRLMGDDATALRAGTQALTQAIADSYQELRNIEDTLPATNRQLRLDLTPRARELGLNEAQLAQQLSVAVDGVTVQSFNQYGADVDIRVRLAESARDQLDLASWLQVQLPGGGMAPLSDLAHFSEQEEPASIVRRDGRQAITITADPASEEVNAQEIQADIEQNLMPGILSAYGLEAAYETGQDAAELLDNLVLAAWAALAMIYIILAFMFQSYSWPLAVMSAIPLAMTGAIFGHLALGLDLNFLSIFGLFGLAGIVINGSIILISRYIELLAEGEDRHTAIVEASCQRFRPVILTTLTTVAGLVPILLETSVQAQMIRSMATSLAFGLGYGAILVLLVIPAILSYVQSASDQLSRFVSWLGPQRDHVQ
ncbi:MAG: efflux RND transporter permease subunit, partial [Natronospirillum sp.]